MVVKFSFVIGRAIDEVFLILDDEDIFDGATEMLPQPLCLSVRFHGSHAESAKKYVKLAGYAICHNLVFADFSREITMIDYGITNDTQKFVTEISIPVKQI